MTVIRKAVEAARARDAARKARDLTRRKSALENSTLPGQARRLLGARPRARRDLHRRGRLRRRLRQAGRDRNTQAILPLRGKIINVEKNRIDKVLSNKEIQALITAIGTGIREEFDIEKARYHKVIVMTDADVDGAHIRTLVLTFLYREMPELIDAGYVYIAKPPLYKVKSGKQDVYIEKESELEEVLLRDKLELMQVHDRERHEVRADPGALAAVRPAAQAVRGLGIRPARRVRPRHDHLPRGVQHPRRRDHRHRRRDRACWAGGPRGRAVRDLAGLGERDRDRRARDRAQDRHGPELPAPARAMFDAPEYAGFVKTHAELKAIAGTPPFDVVLGKHEALALSFEDLRTRVLEVARDGVPLQRFKGLGEMNADQLCDTTMDPEQRTLQLVTIDDASGADQIFSMLMGDAVEPRREFIEDHAREVTNLDV